MRDLAERVGERGRVREPRKKRESERERADELRILEERE